MTPTPGTANGTPNPAPTPLVTGSVPSSSLPSGSTPASISVVSAPEISGAQWHQTGATSAIGQQLVDVTHVDAGAIALMWMDAPALSFRFIPGYQYPEGSPQRSIDHTPSTWVPNMVAAFNGGFHLSDDVGGYFYDGQVVKRLRPGLASLDVTNTGRISVGVWDRTVNSTAGFEVIRQNLQPLVWHGKTQAFPSDSASAWGRANGGLSHANRTALGERADGTVVFAYGYNVQAYEMADALVSAGVRTAVMLDMNKSWPTGYYYEPTGVDRPKGHRILPAIYRNPDTYFAQFKKDFIVADSKIN